MIEFEIKYLFAGVPLWHLPSDDNYQINLVL